jgi:hypothetical protein
MNRRNFLVLGGLLATASLTTVFGMSFFQKRYFSYTKTVLRSYLSQSSLVDQDIAMFSKHFFSSVESRRIRVLALLGDNPSVILPDLLLSVTIQEDLERRLVTAFLFNSDYFSNGESPHFAIRYNGSLTTICGTANPFATFREVTST